MLNVGLAVCRKTVYKSYVCDFSQTILSNLLTPQRGYWIECNTTQVRQQDTTPTRAHSPSGKCPACWRLPSTSDGLSESQLTAAVLLRLWGLLMVIEQC